MLETVHRAIPATCSKAKHQITLTFMLLEQMPTAKRAQCPGNDVDLGGVRRGG